jgi:hypothetical protein
LSSSDSTTPSYMQWTFSRSALNAHASQTIQSLDKYIQSSASADSTAAL